jgi:hypothetical protein
MTFFHRCYFGTAFLPFGLFSILAYPELWVVS